MTATNSDIRSPAKIEKLRRMALWAMLGAASGAVAWVAVWAAVNWVHMENDLLLLIPIMLPGLSFGAVVGLALRRVGLARGWQVALFAALSVPAWYAGFYVGVEYGPDWARLLNADNLYRFYLEFFIIGFVGGTAWAIVQTLAVALLSFARRVRPLATLVAVGAVTAGLLVAIGYIIFGTGISLYLILWTGWYAVYAAVFSLILPWPKSEA